MSNNNSEQWVVATYEKFGNRVVVKYLDPIPSAEIRQQYPDLIVIRWPYDGAANDGMPDADLNAQMIQLEDSLEITEIRGSAMLVYTQTGNNLKEFVFYAKSQQLFMHNLNRVLADQPQYPIEISLYEDPKWEDFSAFLDSIGALAPSAEASVVGDEALRVAPFLES